MHEICSCPSCSPSGATLRMGHEYIINAAAKGATKRKLVLNNLIVHILQNVLSPEEAVGAITVGPFSFGPVHPHQHLALPSSARSVSACMEANLTVLCSTAGSFRPPGTRSFSGNFCPRSVSSLPKQPLSPILDCKNPSVHDPSLCPVL